MIERRPLTHVVVDADVARWLLDPRPSPHAEEARRFIGDRSRVVSFVTVTELRYGTLRAGWGELRLAQRCASLRAEQTRAGHALGQKIHEPIGGSRPRRRR